MTRTPVWASIAETLRTEIAAGHWPAAAKLPTEAELSARFGVNRHTVRRALADLAERGLVHARRGAGVFVTAPATDYPIGRRTRFRQNLEAAGRVPGKRILATATRAADAEEARALALAPGDPVAVCDGLSLADEVPIAVFRSTFPAARFPAILADLQDTGSVTQALTRAGIADYTRLSTRLSAEPATATQALHLRLAEGAPLLKALSINIDPEGRPVEYGVTWFAGERVTLSLSGA